MVYPNFHQPHPEGADVGTLSEPIFHGTDNSTLYEDPYQGLLRQIIAANDIAALRLYQASPHSRVFWEEYEILVWYPFLVTKAYGSCDALRILLKIYLSDPVYQMPEFPPLAEYMVRWKFSPIHMACAATDRDLTIWLLSKRQRNPDERPLATLWDPGNGYGGRTPLIRVDSPCTGPCWALQMWAQRCRSGGRDDAPIEEDDRRRQMASRRES